MNTIKITAEQHADFIDKVRAELVNVGAKLDGELVADGDFNRLPDTGGKTGNKDCSYWIRLDDVPNAFVENKRTGTKINISFDGVLSPETRKQVSASVQAKIDNKPELDAAELAASQKKSTETFRAGDQYAVSSHPRIIAKRTSEYTQARLRISSSGAVMIPYYDLPEDINLAPQMLTISYVSDTADKKYTFLAKCTKKGTCFPLGNFDAARVIAVTESYANADVIYTAMRGAWAVLAAGTAGDIETITKKAIARWPAKQIVIVGDDDAHKDINVGRDAAVAAGAHTNVPVIFPVFKRGRLDPNGKPPTDIWDQWYLSRFNNDQLRTFLVRTLERTEFPDLDYVYLDEIQPEIQPWLWKNVIPATDYTVIAGQAGSGKSQLVAAIVATVSTGGDWPAESGSAEQGAVMLFDAEDDLSKTISPRYIAAGADMSQVQYVKGPRAKRGNRGVYTPAMKLDADLLAIGSHLEAWAKKGLEIKLIVLDPLASYVDADANSNTDVRRQLDPLVAFTSRYEVAVLGVLHTNKASGGGNSFDPIDRISGAGAWTQAARSTWMVIRDPNGDIKRFFLPVKVNTAPDDVGFSFIIEEVRLDDKYLSDEVKINGGIVTSKVVFGDEIVTESAASLLGLGTSKPSKQLEKAKQYLLGRLPDGRVEVGVLIQETTEGNDKISRQTLYRARKELRIIGIKEDGKTYWELPPMDPRKVPSE